MKRVDMVEMFSTPAFYQPPPDDQLSTNTDYPNLNSREYLTRPYTVTPASSRRFNECLSVNDLGNAVLVSNSYTDRIWHGHFWGFETLSDVESGEAKSSFRRQCKATVSQLQYVDTTMILLGDTSGHVELWSTKADVRSTAAYCLFNIGRQSEHSGSVTALDVCAERITAVSGSQDGCIKDWDMGSGDLYSISTYRAAHSREITGLASSPDQPNVFASCSRDRCLNIWDKRLSTPIVDFNETHNVGFTALNWLNPDGTDVIYVGDEAGWIFSIDPRSPKIFVTSRKIFEAPIHRLRFSGSKVAVIANSSEIKVLDTAVDGCVIFTNNDAKDYVRDAHWSKSTELWTIGWDSAVQTHIFDA